jgi:hypothetical protein
MISNTSGQGSQAKVRYLKTGVIKIVTNRKHIYINTEYYKGQGGTMQDGVHMA